MEINSNNKNKEIILYKIDNNEDLYDESEKLLNKSKTEVEKGNFNLAKELFRKALNTNGDPACFFFGDVVRILIDKNIVNFSMDNLYTEYGITNIAMEQLQALPDVVIIKALEIYFQKRDKYN